MKPVNMLEGPVSKSIVRFSVPMFLTFLIQLLYHTTDTLFVGRFLGTNAQAAVGTGGNLITLIIGLLGGITIGVSVVIGHHFGAKDREGLSRATTTAAFLVLAMSLLFTVFGVLFCGTYLHLVHTPDEIFPTAVQYLRVYCLSIPAMVTYNVAVGMLRATGDSFRPMLFQLFGGILNLGLDALFLAVLRTGAVGSAWGTLIAQTLVAIVAVFYLLRQDDTFVLRRTPLSAVRDEAGNILSIGLPAGLQSMLITLSNVLITAEINRFGPVTIAAFSVYFEVELLLFYPILSFGQATSVFVSQNLGARQDIRVRSGIRTILGIGTGSTVAVSAVCILLSELLFSAFSKDPDVIALGVSMVRITFPLYFIYVFLQVLGDALRAMQHSFGVMLIILLNIGLARVLIMYALLHAYGTVQALVAVYPITWFTAAVSMAVLYIAKTKNFNKGEDSYETQVV